MASFQTRPYSLARARGPRLLSFLAAVLVFAAGLVPSAFGHPQAELGVPAEPQAAATGDTRDHAALIVWNLHITDFRVPFEDWSPAERAQRAAARIRKVPAEQDKWTIAYRAEELGDFKGYLFTLNGEFAFRLLEGDVDTEAGQTLADAAREAEARLNAVMDSRYQQGRMTVVLRGIALAILVTLVFGATLVGATRLQRTVHARVSARLSHLHPRFVVAGVNLWPILGGLRQVLARIVNWSVLGLLVFLWLTLTLEQFPYTKPWGDAFGGFLLQVLTGFAWGVVSALPNLFVVLLIGALTHAFNRGVGSYFLAVESGEVSVAWLTSEVARATRQIFALLTWVFALIVAYPYIPGSQTAAFKGVTVFFGLMMSLGSAGLVNQVMSGLTVIYSRAYRRGEFVRIGEQEGRVRNLGLLATQLVKAGGTEVSIPNAVVTGNTITNFSRGGAGASEVLVTSVTIGYDAPWRQVHGMLQLAAKRTPQLAPQPEPFVIQRALSDFYVEYQLHAHLAEQVERAAALSRLHAEIQDSFNEHGVQIMSPHFEGQPDHAVVVPRSAWFAEPADGANPLNQKETPQIPAERSGRAAR